MLYSTARRVAGMVLAGHQYLYTDRDIAIAIEELETSSLYGRGLPSFDADLSALYKEREYRQEGTNR